MNEDYVELVGEERAESEEALLFYCYDRISDNDRPVWILKDHIRYVEKSNGDVIITIPEWLAEEKNLI